MAPAANDSKALSAPFIWPPPGRSVLRIPKSIMGAQMRCRTTGQLAVLRTTPRRPGRWRVRDPAAGGGPVDRPAMERTIRRSRRGGGSHEGLGRVLSTTKRLAEC
ncbi:hypothetical protein CN245_18135 [Sinorhizobium meliloti]|nr:hypothetical protein CN245_18135 [Sinorhizobium meliloti]